MIKFKKAGDSYESDNGEWFIVHPCLSTDGKWFMMRDGEWFESFDKLKDAKAAANQA